MELKVKTRIVEGRLDILVVFNNCCIIIEFEYEKAVDTAVKQMIEKKYATVFNNKTLCPDKVEKFLLLGISLIKKKIYRCPYR